jgi:hypothetical protein
MNRLSIVRAVTLFTSLMLFSPIAHGIALNQVDSFQDGTAQGWNPGATNISTGGPAGSGDRYIQIGSGLFGSAPNLAVKNSDVRWIGNYTAAGVTRVEVDLRNQQATPLEMRAVLFNGSTNRATSTIAFNLPADNTWHHAIFNIQAADLTVVNGLASAATILSNVTILMFRQDAGSPSPGGTSVDSQIGLDNIASVPEPASVLLLVAGLMMFVRRSK